MKKTIIASIVLVVLGTSNVNADVSVTWENPDNYSDIDGGEQSQKKFQAEVTKQLEAYIVELSKRLAEGQKLSIKVTDLDLAGEVLPGFSQGLNSPRDMRVVKRVYFPTMDLEYQLTDSQGAILKSGSAELKDISFQDNIQSYQKARDPLAHEKDMIKEWFDKTFSQRVATK
ncbi:DUF3016 domain-containing protein [Kangiella sp. TOML190]|uniref:DUF3016 domain-containing protein n=1 Tax=Kangiella sp. TOML190 TaxID=2931351 RepID=UPI002041B36F|nr:DUF3016 domain-containing protein [Kangiella sp. TOML190]